MMRDEEEGAPSGQSGQDDDQVEDHIKAHIERIGLGRAHEELGRIILALFLGYEEAAKYLGEGADKQRPLPPGRS